jgi:hypothetical protein
MKIIKKKYIVLFVLLTSVFMNMFLSFVCFSQKKERAKMELSVKTDCLSVNCMQLTTLIRFYYDDDRQNFERLAKDLLNDVIYISEELEKEEIKEFGSSGNLSGTRLLDVRAVVARGLLKKISDKKSEDVTEGVNR